MSREKYDWLGNGMYFWENNYQRALDWANEKFQRKKISNPAVIGAVIDLGYCCDFLNAEHIRMFKHAYQHLAFVHKEAAITLHQNRDLPQYEYKDKILRELDCAVIEHMHENILTRIREDIREQGFTERRLPDSVRGAFIEGRPAFEGSGIHEKTHIQIAIRNPNCIKGFFLPRKERVSEGFHYDLDDISEDGFIVSEPDVPYGI